jgi:hydrogenase nickel incorporation protein HypA/HybF
MHELSVTESLLEIALKHAQNAKATHITDIYLVIGQLASIVDDSVQFYWDIISKDTIAEGAELHFKRLPTEFLCKICNHHYKPIEKDLSCPMCSSTKIDILTGREFFVESIEIET